MVTLTFARAGGIANLEGTGGARRGRAERGVEARRAFAGQDRGDGAQARGQRFGEQIPFVHLRRDPVLPRPERAGRRSRSRCAAAGTAGASRDRTDPPPPPHPASRARIAVIAVRRRAVLLDTRCIVRPCLDRGGRRHDWRMRAWFLMRSSPPGGKRQAGSIIVRDNNVDQALRALKKKLQREGVYREMKLRPSL
ncbi:ribosomal protein s21 domain-containing protein [Ditylenchus destructor]|uniref:Ribosomal protein s21 domain-containing protein n=1 Tax=Ditylenchus destructor TaxID=166010 RepID=A0AAD4QWE7_9BILA|nr:ribosomal protein s21 domain-containing protein [Ditylenchus destructor]